MFFENPVKIMGFQLATSTGEFFFGFLPTINYVTTYYLMAKNVKQKIHLIFLAALGGTPILQ